MLVQRMAMFAGIAVPTISSFTLGSPTKASGCVAIQMSGNWTVLSPDNTAYKLVIQETGVEYICASAAGASVYDVNTYQDGSTSTIAPTLTLQVVRRSDSVVMSSVSATCSPGLLVGVPCV